jgi:sterol desaturase/sphingolipid hydroxylase (fatty acid hydroxylase superfamily)
LELNLDDGRLAIFIGGLLLFLLVERLLPARAWTGARWRRLAFHAGIAALNTVIIRLFVYVPFLLWTVHVEQEGWGISRWLGLVGWTEILISIVVLDAFDYLWHRVNHRLPFLWRFHKAHHADVEMDATTSLRFHPGELVISALVKGLWILVWGPTVVAWFLFEALVSLSAQFHHSNIDFPDRVERWLSLVVVTPRYHAAHHAVDRRWGDANFSTILSVWDRLFGTYERPADGGATTNTPGALGLPEGRELAFSPLAWLDEPLRSRNLGLARVSGASDGGGTVGDGTRQSRE